MTFVRDTRESEFLGEAIFSEAELQQRFAPFAILLGDIPLQVGLIGELGVGKTRIAKAILSALGYKASEVVSPSFSLCQEYEHTPVSVEHWDLYRLSAVPEELSHVGDLTVSRLIEWADKFPEVLELCDITLSIHFAEDKANAEHVRSIVFDAQEPSQAMRDIIRSICTSSSFFSTLG